MLRISIPFILETLSKANAVGALPAKASSDDAWFPLLDLEFHLNSVYSNIAFTPFLRISKPTADVLLHNLSRINATIGTEPEVETLFLKFHIQNLRTLFLAELNVLPSFLVTGREGFDVNLLIDRGEVLFPPALLKKLPATEKDAKEAGRALAFELGTACGFHLFRVMESVTRQYWDEVAKCERPRLQTLGTFAAELEKNRFGSERIWESLKQLSRLHRNPIIHPEVILTVEEAIGLLGIARSVIGAMLEFIPEPSTAEPESTVAHP